ncbi:hypothetical protein HK104_001087, partial [Borealophlyctis nickersoniae]
MAPRKMSPPKAVIFDIGGVVVHSPLEGVRKYEQKHGLPRDYLNIVIQAKGENGAFQRLERGELALEDFFPAFGADLSDGVGNRDAYAAWAESKGIDVGNIPKITVDGKELFTMMMTEASTVDDNMVTAIKNLR